jgi:hypothetical protein
MAGPRIDERYKYMTLPQAAKRLDIHPAKLRRRLKDGIFPPPTFVNEYGLKFFDEDWLKKTQAILEKSFENKERRQQEG